MNKLFRCFSPFFSWSYLQQVFCQFRNTMCERRARKAASERRYFVQWTRFAVITAVCVCVPVHCTRLNYNLNICERFPRLLFIHENPLVILRIVHSALRSPHIPFIYTLPFTLVANTMQFQINMYISVSTSFRIARWTMCWRQWRAGRQPVGICAFQKWPHQNADHNKIIKYVLRQILPDENVQKREDGVVTSSM